MLLSRQLHHDFFFLKKKGFPNRLWPNSGQTFPQLIRLLRWKKLHLERPFRWTSRVSQNTKGQEDNSTVILCVQCSFSELISPHCVRAWWNLLLSWKKKPQLFKKVWKIPLGKPGLPPAKAHKDPLGLGGRVFFLIFLYLHSLCSPCWGREKTHTASLPACLLPFPWSLLSHEYICFS